MQCSLAIVNSNFCARILAKRRNFYENNIDLAKSGLESGARIDKYVYQNKEEIVHYRYKNKSPPF